MRFRMSDFNSRVRDLCARLIPVGLLAMAGCVAPPISGPVLTHPPSESLRAEWQTIGVSGVSGGPQAIWRNTRGKGQGALAGAGNAAGITIGVFSLGGPYGTAVGIMVSPASALVGTIVGAIKAEPASKVEEQCAVLDRAFASIDWPSLIRDPVIDAGQRRTRFKFMPLDARGVATSPATNTAYQAVLEVQVTELALVSGAAANPDLQFVMATSARIMRLDSTQALYEQRLLYDGPVHRFAEWTADDARLWREQVELARQRLADRIVHEVFLLYQMEESVQ